MLILIQAGKDECSFILLFVDFQFFHLCIIGIISQKSSVCNVVDLHKSLTFYSIYLYSVFVPVLCSFSYSGSVGQLEIGYTDVTNVVIFAQEF